MSRPSSKIALSDKKTRRLQMLISPNDYERIEDYRFRNRIGTMAEAIRRLCEIALECEQR